MCPNLGRDPYTGDASSIRSSIWFGASERFLFGSDFLWPWPSHMDGFPQDTALDRSGMQVNRC